MRRAGLLVVALAGCTQATTVQQAGVIPPARAMGYDGQPLTKGARIEGRLNTGLTDVSAAEEGENSGLYVARETTTIALRGGYKWFDSGIELDLAWVAGSRPVRDGLLPRPDADTAIGVQFPTRVSADLGGGLRFGFGLSYGFVSVPVNVNGNTERDEAFSAAIAMVPSYRTGNVAVFGGLHVATEIDVPGALVIDDAYDAPEARNDGGAVIVAGGGSLFFDSGLKITAQVASAPATQIANYGVQVDLLFGFEWGKQKAPQIATGLPWERKRRPPPQPYPYPYPPPPPPPPAPPPADPEPQPAPDPY